MYNISFFEHDDIGKNQREIMHLLRACYRFISKQLKSIHVYQSSIKIYNCMYVQIWRRIGPRRPLSALKKDILLNSYSFKAFPFFIQRKLPLAKIKLPLERGTYFSQHNIVLLSYE